MWWCIVSVAASVAGRKEKMLLFKMRFSSYRLFYFLSCISRSILQIMSGLACMYYLWIVIGYEQEFMDVDLV